MLIVTSLAKFEAFTQFFWGKLLFANKVVPVHVLYNVYCIYMLKCQTNIQNL